MLHCTCCHFPNSQLHLILWGVRWFIVFAEQHYFSSEPLNVPFCILYIVYPNRTGWQDGSAFLSVLGWIGQDTGAANLTEAFVCKARHVSPKEPCQDGANQTDPQPDTSEAASST